MRNQPKYADTIIVMVKYKERYRWFVTDQELWFLDLKKLIFSYLDKGFVIPNPDDFSERFNIAIVNEDTVEEFLERISKFEVSKEKLMNVLVWREYNDISDMLPSLYVNFDDKELISSYPEPASYERYVPNGWLGKYEQFTSQIPVDYRYWMVNGENLFLKENNNE